MSKIMKNQAFHFKGIVYESNEKPALPKDIQKCELFEDCLKKMGTHVAKILGEIEGSWVENI